MTPQDGSRRRPVLAWLARLAALCALSVSAWSGAGTAADAPAFPQFQSPRQVRQSCDHGLAVARAQLGPLLRRPVDSGWLRAYDAYLAGLEDLSGPVSLVAAVHPDPPVRAAAEACELRWNSFYSGLFQQPGLYRAVRRLVPADAIDRELQKQLREGFEDAGAALPPAQRRRAKQLADRIAALGQAFERQIRDQNVRLAFTEDELAGVPEGVWKAARRDAQGRVVLGTSLPEYTPVMERAELPATRERMWRAKTNEGGAANLQRLAQIVQLRHRHARLLGAPSWADVMLRRRMAETPQRAQAFLDEVKAAVQARERREIDELRAAKAQHVNQPVEATRLARWDLPFYMERVRQARFRVDQEAFRKHFPPEAGLAWALRLVEHLLGVRYERHANAPTWHPEVQVYAVKDASSEQPLGTLYVDLYPREGKYNHAAVWPLRGSASHLQRSSQSALVVNFDRQGLSLDELETLLHELGHAVHGNLSATRYLQQAGTSVPGDFVEAPSQMLEDWVYDARALGLMAEVCPRCEPVPAELLAQAQAARHYGKGVATARQHLYADYDLALHGPRPQDPLALWQRLEGDTPLGHVPGTLFPAGFSHIATHYGAGYYGYLWSLVVAADLRTAFAADRLDPQVGLRYRRSILANGSQLPPAEMVRNFLGRDFNARAFFGDLSR
jgi:thimet oligopeptidase